ncbi:MAG TPA: ATP-dependent DNA helicase [Acidimicrobiales bacterium]|nr:ATP-dependent DNA helicase [Acidimicrobiales bacterium]
MHTIWGAGRGPAEDPAIDGGGGASGGGRDGGAGGDGAGGEGATADGGARPTADEVTAASDQAERWLARVTATLPGGQPRPQQATMARSVAAAMAGGRHLVVQAGTGTGKSLAYVVPAVASGRKVVVATATKALQDQLAQKDLPAAAQGLPRPFSFAVLKGRSNYLCLQRTAEVDGRGHQQELAADPTAEADPGDPGVGTAGDGEGAAEEGGAVDPGRLVDQVRQLVAWAADTGTGDRADLPFEPHPRAWAMVSVGPRECPGAFRCPSGGRCFAERARAEAAAADVVVVNTHLYGAHLASGGAVLPEHDVVVFDEAHEVEEIMTASLGAEITPGRLRALQGMVRPLLRDEDGAEAAADLGMLADRLQQALQGRLGTRVLHLPVATPRRRAPTGPEPGGRERAEPERAEPEPVGRERAGRERARAAPEPTGPGAPSPEAPSLEAPSSEDQALVEVLERAASRVDRVLALLRRPVAGRLLDGGGGGPGATGGDDGPKGRALSAAGHLVEDLSRLAGRGDDEVAWVDGTVRAPVLRLSPVDVGPPLAEQLWGEVTGVLTSATIPQRLPERLGLQGFAVDEEDVGSPFDYRTHALLYVARHLPDRRRPESEAAIHEELAALIGAAGGRTLALFTSRRATEAAAAELEPVLPYRVLVQGQLPKGRLLAAFAEEETSCLFATLGFWQGVDVPGRSLSLVTLDRLPFARPDDPLLQARRDRAGDAAFQLVDLPRAATLLAQGTGRLIRSADDYGVVAVLDPRLATAGYRRVLLAGVPPMKRTTDRSEVEAFLARVLANPAGQ